MLRIYGDLTKFGIVVFVLFSAFVGYATSYRIENHFDAIHFLLLLGGVYFLSSGSLALNQFQE